MKVERAPSGLKANGGALWRAVVAEFELRPDERQVLQSACHLADEIAALEAELVSAPTLIAGSKGQMRPNPLYAEARSHRLALGRLLALLGLEDARSAGAGLARSAAGRKLAASRWQRKGA